VDAGEGFGREAHSEFELVVALDDVWLAFPFAESFPVHEPPHPGPMTVNGHGIIAAVDHAVYERFSDTFSYMSAAERHVEGTVVAVEIGKAAGHAFEDMEIFGIGEAGFGGAMSGDDVDAAFEWKSQDTRIRIVGPDDGHGVFAAGVGQERKTSLGHALPEANEAAIVAINVLAVGKAFHHHGAAGQTMIKFFESVGASGMDRDGREEFRVLASKFQDVVVGDIKRAGIFERTALIVVDKVLSEDDRVTDGGGAYLFEQALDVKAVEIAFQAVQGQADAANHDGGEWTMPAGDTEPAAGAAGTVADDVHVGVDEARGCRLQVRNF